MIRSARVIAVDGAHGTGKTTLVYALASRLKERHLHVGVQGDAARQSPLVEDVMIHGKGAIDLVTELHILASQLAGEQMLARHHEIVVCDKSVLSVIAYTRLFLGATLSGDDQALLDAMATLVQRYASRYDAVFLLADLYDLDSTEDPLRPVDDELRMRASELIRAECDAGGTVVHEVPRGLSTADKVDWVLTRSEGPDDG